MVHRNYHNGLKTTLLLGGMWALLVCIGALVARGTGQAIWILLFAGIGLAQTAYSYWNSASLALRSMNAYPVSELERPELYAIVRELAERAGQPMPLIWVAPTMTPNAFATGRDPNHAAVCCTEGILAILNERELRGVLGHELMHVYNRDILTSSVAAAMGGLITSVAQFLMFFGATNRRDEEGGSGIFGVLGILAMSILAPIASTLIQFSISRTREFDADEDGAELTHDSVELWPFEFGDRVRIHRAQRQRRRVPVRVGGLRESDPREQEDPNCLPRAPRHERANAHQQRPHATQQEGRLEAIVIVAVHHARDPKEVTWERPEKHPSHR